MSTDQVPAPDAVTTQPTVAEEKMAATPPPPDGGLHAWCSVAGAFLCQFCSFGFINALGTFQVEYETNILPTNSSSSISWILTFQLFLMFFLSQLVGVGVDMFGPRAITIPSSFLAVGGLVALSFAHEYYQVFLAQSVCFGIGAAGIFMPGLVVAGQQFKKRRALALGVVASGSSLGGVVFPIFLAKLFLQVGFAASMRWTALMIGVLLVIANLLIRSTLKAKGFAGRRAVFRLDVFKNTTFLIYVSGAFCFFWGLFGPFSFLPAFASGFPETSYLALYTVSIINAASIVGRVVPAHFADRLGRLATMTMFSYVSAVSALVIWLPVNFYPTAAGVIIFALVFGFASGAFVSLMSTCLIDVSGGHTHDLGAMLGTYMMIVSFAALTGSPIEAAISEKESIRPTGLVIWSGVLMLVGSGLINAAWLMWSRKRSTRGSAGASH